MHLCGSIQHLYVDACKLLVRSLEFEFEIDLFTLEHTSDQSDLVETLIRNAYTFSLYKRGFIAVTHDLSNSLKDLDTPDSTIIYAQSRPVRKIIALNDMFAVAIFEKMVEIWNMQLGSFVIAWQFSTEVAAITTSLDTLIIVLDTIDCFVIDLIQLKPLYDFHVSGTNNNETIIFHEYKGFLFYYTTRFVEVRNARSGTVLKTLQFTSDIRSVEIQDDFLVVLTGRGFLRVYSTDTWEEKYFAPFLLPVLYAYVVNPECVYLMMESSNRIVKVDLLQLIRNRGIIYDRVPEPNPTIYI